MNYKEEVCVPVEDIIKRLQGKIKLEFEVERMEPLLRIRKNMTRSRIVMPLTRLKHAL